MGDFWLCHIPFSSFTISQQPGHVQPGKNRGFLFISLYHCTKDRRTANRNAGGGLSSMPDKTGYKYENCKGTYPSDVISSIIFMHEL
jgi:hypothetical protein